jgi:hypothetical protein
MAVEFGCEYCRDRQNFHFGHVTQIGSNVERGMVLLQCPRCDALYENTPSGADRIGRLTPQEADELYPPHPRPSK